MTADDVSRLMTKTEVAELCKVSLRTVTNWHLKQREGFPRPEVIGKILLVWFRSEVQAWLETAVIIRRPRKAKGEAQETTGEEAEGETTAGEEGGGGVFDSVA